LIVTVTPYVTHAATSTPVVASNLTVFGIPYSKGIAKDLVNYYAGKWDVDAGTMWAIVKCENPSLNPKQQSGWHYTTAQINRHPSWGDVGDQERSFGLVQIHLPDNPKVSYREATNPDFSLDFLGEKLANNQGNKWTCYRTLNT
jgi:hypothetical protein